MAPNRPRYANHDAQPGDFTADALDDFPQESRPVLEAAAVRTRPLERTEKFVAQVAMTMLDVDEFEAALGRQPRGDDKRIADRSDFIVGQHAEIFGNAEPLFKNRMVIQHPWLCTLLFARPGEPTGMRQLQADVQIAGLTERLGVGGDQRVAQTGDRIASIPIETKLIRIGPAIRRDGYGLAPPDPFRPTQAKPPPSPLGVFGRPPAQRSVPALHRQNRESVADDAAPSLERLTKRPRSSGLDGGFERELDTQGIDVLPELIGRIEAGNARIHQGSRVFELKSAQSESEMTNDE